MSTRRMIMCLTAVAAVGTALVATQAPSLAAVTVHVWATKVTVRDPHNVHNVQGQSADVTQSAVTPIGPGDFQAVCQVQLRNQEVSQATYHNNWWTELILNNQTNGLNDGQNNDGLNDGLNNGLNDGQTRGWVNDVYISGGGNDQPVPGPPVCPKNTQGN